MRCDFYVLLWLFIVNYVQNRILLPKSHFIENSCHYLKRIAYLCTEIAIY